MRTAQLRNARAHRSTYRKRIHTPTDDPQHNAPGRRHTYAKKRAAHSRYSGPQFKSGSITPELSRNTQRDLTYSSQRPVTRPRNKLKTPVIFEKPPAAGRRKSMALAQMQLFFAKNGAIAYQAQKKRETKKFSLIILCNIGAKKFGRKTQNFTVKFLVER